MSAFKTVLATQDFNFKDQGGGEFCPLGKAKLEFSVTLGEDASENATGTWLHLPESGHLTKKTRLVSGISALQLFP